MRKDSPFPLSSAGPLLLQCEQADLHHALIACVRFSKLDPFCAWVLLTAQVPAPGAVGWLRIETWSERAGAGVWARIPACIALCGRIALPFQPLTDLVAQLRPGMVQLAQSQVSNANALAPFHLESAPVFTANLVLALEQVSRSQRGTQSTQRARLRALPPTELGPMLPVRKPGQPLAQMSATQWCHALTCCVLLTKEQAQPSPETPEMDHSLVLMRFASDHWDLFASTRERLVHCALPFLEPAAPAPLEYALFPGPALAWIGRSLRAARESGPVMLSLDVDQEQNQVELLVQACGSTFVCRGTSEAIPKVWEKPLRLPTIVEMVVSRKALSQALTSLSVARRQAEWNGVVQVLTKEGSLVVQWVTGAERQIVGQREIPLLQATSDLESVWVDLRQWRQMLALYSDATVSLQFGPLQGHPPADSLGFLRLTTSEDSPVFMMTLSRLPSPPSGQEEAPDKEEAVVASV